ncbi:Uncharacterized protein GBIM_00427 [Gryllus bimaculatus]|nr:Uncharacterized protein GBIM_00427 [Gryllus bimaculatus]
MAVAVAVLAVAVLRLAGTASAAGAGPEAEAARVAAALMDPQAPLPWHAAGLASLSLLPAWGEMGLSENCTRDLLQMAYSFGNGSAWAIKMFDASTKIPDGLLGGHLVHLGNFDECLSVRQGEGDGSPGFDGQHCLVAFSAKLGGGGGEELEELGAQEDFDEWQRLLHAVQSSLMLHGRTHRVDEARDIPESGALASLLSYIPIQLAWCTPSTCTPQDLETVALAAVNLTSLKATATVDPAKCHTHVGKKLRGVDVFAISAASLISDLFHLQQLVQTHRCDKWSKPVDVPKRYPNHQYVLGDSCSCLRNVCTDANCEYLVVCKRFYRVVQAAGYHKRLLVCRLFLRDERSTVELPLPQGSGADQPLRRRQVLRPSIRQAYASHGNPRAYVGDPTGLRWNRSSMGLSI